MKLKLLNWNVWVFNSETEKIAQFLNEQKADVVCLQEVSAALLSDLMRRTSYPVMFKALDAYHKSGGDRSPSFLVLMTRCRVVDAHRVVYKKQKKRVER